MIRTSVIANGNLPVVAFHHLKSCSETLSDHYSKGLPPVLTIDSGDTVIFETLDVAWNLAPVLDWEPVPVQERPSGSVGDGPPLVGPVAINGAEPGDLLEVIVEGVRPKTWGWTRAGGRDQWPDSSFGATAAQHLAWKLDPDAMIATSQTGIQIAMRPFMGMMGICPAGDGSFDGWTPRQTGGNLDCTLLTKGSSLFLPVAVSGALFANGDGHAVQGDGELCGCAIECPMEEVRLRFVVHKGSTRQFLHAETPTEWATFGFAEQLNEALVEAGNRMLDLLAELYPGIGRAEALCLASCVVNFRVTQVANPHFGVHAVLAKDAVRAFR